jgi:hypothetical protein
MKNAGRFPPPLGSRSRARRGDPRIQFDTRRNMRWYRIAPLALSWFAAAGHAEDLQGFPVKIEVAHSARTMTVSYKDVSVESPDAKLFMLPAKCPDFRTGEPQGGKKPAVKKPAAKPVAPPVQKPPQQ